MSLLDFEGRTLWNQQQEIEVAALNSKSYLSIPIDPLLAGKNPRSVFLFAELLVAGKPVSRNEHFFQPYKSLLLPQPQISAEAAPNYAGFFADNYFDLVPGTKVEVEFRTGGAVAVTDFRSHLRIRSMADSF